MDRKINHVGIAVKSISDVFDFYKNVLGLEYQGEETVEEQKVKVAFFKAGESRIELLEATSPDSPIAKFIEKKGEGIHHLALGSNKLEDDIEGLISQEVRMIDKKPRNGAHQTKIAFVHPKASKGVLLELTEDKKH